MIKGGLVATKFGVTQLLCFTVNMGIYSRTLSLKPQLDTHNIGQNKQKHLV